MEAVLSSETMSFYRTIRRPIPDDISHLNSTLIKRPNFSSKVLLELESDIWITHILQFIYLFVVYSAVHATGEAI
jgi:hypothetical protein